MAEKFSILKTLDLHKLNKEIDVYKLAHREEPYIFMNGKTKMDIVKNSDPGAYFEPREYCIITKYSGYKVFIDPTLEYGEIELR